VKTSKPIEVAPKRLRNEGLPEWVNPQWFRFTFVSTYMMFVGQTLNPWDVPVKQALSVMKKIWAATSKRDYEITPSTAVYKKVCDHLASKMNDFMLCFRQFNALRTRGAVVLDLLASQQSWRSVTLNRI
jgi:hypothetical protein